jgi:hypothetical protein
VTTIVTAIDIAAPPDAVASVLLDADAAPLWTRDLERLELIDGTVGEAGSVALAHYVQRGRPYVLEDRLVAVTPNRHYRSQITGEGLVVAVETSLEPNRHGTRLTLTWSGAGSSPMMRMMLPFLRPFISRRAQDDLRSFRALVESAQRQDT